MTPGAVRRGGAGPGHPLRGRRGLAGRGAGRRHGQGRVRDHARRRSRRPGARIARPLSARGIGRRRSRVRAHGRARGRHGGGAGQRVDLPLDIRGTAFQQRVWAALSAIPSGKTATYREIARAIGQPKAVRAVAQAAAPIRSQSRSPVIGWRAPTATSPAIAGELSASAR